MRAGGCDFAVDPSLSAQATHPIWLPRVNPRLAVLTSLPPELFGGLETTTAQVTTLALAPEGTYSEILALPPARQALFLGDAPESFVGIVIPLDDLLEDRIATARRLHLALTRGVAKPSSISPFRRARLKLALRALDGRSAGAGYRELARGLFPRLLGRDREPSEAVLGRAIRLARYGLRLVGGGYLDLLRPERRAPKRRRTLRQHS